MCENVNSFMPRKAEGQLRIVTNNVLCQCINESEDRKVGLLTAYEHFNADVITLQEADTLWNTKYGLNVELAKLGYQLVPMNAKDRFPDKEDINNPNPVYYNTSTFDLVDSGFGEYDKSMLTDGKYNPRWYSWAYLKEKTTGKELVVITTHFIWRLTDKSITPEVNKERSDKYRVESAKQIVALVAALQEKYPLAAVLATGDYNTNYESEPYAIMKNALISARDVCESKVNMEYQTCNPLGKIPPVGNDHTFDHIFYSKKGIKAKHFETLVCPETYAYTDHVPAMLDFMLE